MSVFNILQRHQSIHQHGLLEASAGTGKTFAIENIVVRLLIEPPPSGVPITIDQILVVTFTQAATRDLKMRIHANLKNAVKLLKDQSADLCPDFLLSHIEKGQEAVNLAKRRLEEALFSFDQAQIFTIHSFCWRMLKKHALEGGISLSASSKEERSFLNVKLMQAIRDFLRTELLPENYSQEQLKIILKRARGNIENLQEDLLSTLNRGLDIIPSPHFGELVGLFQQTMAYLKHTFGFTGDNIYADFLLCAPSYKELFNKHKQLHEHVSQKILCFAALFDKESWNENDLNNLIGDGLFLLEALDGSQLKEKASLPAKENLHYPEFISLLRTHLEPIVSQASNKGALFARLAYDCQSFLRHYQQAEEILGHGDLLVQMKNAVNQTAFAESIRSLFKAAIVDEFQDTDPIQWDIFASLFASPQANWNGYLYLVGDPKQSIYAFRQADIYTYLSAANTLGKKALYTLQTNFRSQPSLIQALNALFHAAPGLFPLPKQAKSLDYRPVDAGREELAIFSDKEAPLQFWIVEKEEKRNEKYIEENYFFPAIANQILKLHTHDKIPLSKFAVLVADRYQARRLAQFLKQSQIPVCSQKAIDLSKSSALEALQILIKGVLHYRDLSALKLALGGRLIGMNCEELANLEDHNKLAPTLYQCEQLHKTFENSGFAEFYTRFMQSCWHPGQGNVLERLLKQKEGFEFYCEWQDIAELVISEEGQSNLATVESLIAFLDQFEILSKNDDERIRAHVDQEHEGVAILTTHVSKGLEFDLVFALGLMHRTSLSDDKLISVQNEQQMGLGSSHNPHDLRKHQEEIDSEKMRQLYVAMTRAKYRLYIPVIFSQTASKLSFGEASPIELFLARLSQSPTDYEGLYQRINQMDSSSLRAFVTNQSQCSYIALDKSCAPPAISKSNVSLELSPPIEIKIPHNNLFVQSFTSLSHAIESPSLSVTENSVPHDFTAENKDEHSLPSSNETGTLLHRILEEIPFHAAKEIDDPLELLPLIRPFISHTAFSLWENTISKIIFNALKTPLSYQNQFCLADIDPQKIYRETEFLFSCHEKFLGQPAIRQGYLKGVIDLFFEYKDKYYLLDWKSNWLGPNVAAYQPSGLQAAMQANQYDLQASLYVEAVRRYLRLFDKRPFESIFGGVYYVFLRGPGILRADN